MSSSMISQLSIETAAIARIPHSNYKTQFKTNISSRISEANIQCYECYQCSIVCGHF